MRAGLILTAVFLLVALGAGKAAQNFGGVGLGVVPTSLGELAVLRVLEGSPAAASGMRPGDLIIEVDGFVLRGSDFPEVAARRLWGEAGTSVKLIYLRPGEAGRREITLTRVLIDRPDKPLPGVQLLLPENGERRSQ